MWELVASLLKDPEQLCANLERMIEQERGELHGDPDHEAKVWLEKLAETDRMRSGYQDLAAKGLMTLEELGEKLQDLQETRKTAEHELQALKNRWERIDQLKRDKDTLVESYASMAPEALDHLRPEERHQVYRMLRLRVRVYIHGILEVSGAFTDSLSVSNLETAST